MNRSRIYLILLVLVVLGVGVYVFFPVDDKSVITSQLLKLGELASYGPDEPPLKKQRAIGQMKTLLSSDLVLQVNLQGGRFQTIEGRREFMDYFRAVRFEVPAILVAFEVSSIDLLPDRKSATVLMTLSAQIGIEKQQEYQEMKALMEKTSDGWLVKRLETVRTYGR